MKLTKWSPFFDVDVDSPLVPIWVSFPNLRPHLFSPRILHGLGSLFGKPLKIDNATSVGSRPSVARVLVELDVTKRFPDRIWLGSEKYGYIQHVDMEVFLSFCEHCKALGHSRVDCHILHTQLANTSLPLFACVGSDPKDFNVNAEVAIVSPPPFNVLAVGTASFDNREVAELPLVVNGSSELVALAPVGPVFSEAGVNDLALDLGNVVSCVAKDLALNLGSTDVVVGNDVGLSVIADGSLASVLPLNDSVYVGEVVAPLAIHCSNIDGVEGVDVFMNANNCCTNLIASSTCAVAVEVSGEASLPSVELGNSDDVASDEGCEEVLVPLVDVPIFVISNVDMFAHLARDNVMRQGDWLDDGYSLSGGEEFMERELDVRDNFDLSLLQIADAGFFKKSVKHRKRKSKKK
ncbi:hypothetical protein M5K25_026317 [Dendrobium thyrsiflorum]|uniref:DUF4283 domain-containing protein n=1 Tax=Dendrobium thyrsiflorum TaxID=117978 RepID=A0ABD0TX58_DENTH